MKKEDQILEAIKKLQETQDRTIFAVLDLQEDMKSVKKTVSTLVTRDEYLHGQNLVIKQLGKLEQERTMADSHFDRIDEKIGLKTSH